MNLDEYRQSSFKVWERMAPGWERRRDFIWDVSRGVGEQMVATLAPEPGQTILELAAGPGDTGFAAAALLGEGGRLISTDFSPEMVETARRRGGELGLSNVEYRVMDAEHMDLDDGSVDGVLCRWGYMLMADPEAALAETRRVLRSGGRLVLSVWGSPERNPWAAVPGGLMVARGHLPMPQPGDPGIFALADRERLNGLVAAAGFEQPRIEEVDVRWRFADADEVWSFLTELAGALAMALAELPDEEREAVRAELAQQLESFNADGGYELPGLTLNAVTE